MNLPGHELVSPEPLRDVPGQRRVYRTVFEGRACVTRVLLGVRLGPRFAPMLGPLVREGRGSLPGVPEALALTLEGYRVAARLTPTDPPAWPRALTAGLTPEGHVYVTTTWMPGIPLHEVQGPLAEPERVALDLLRALAALHRQHVVYGDLKPANVVLGPEGDAALIDLDTLREVGGVDIAAPSRDLTRGWAAPEQEQGHTLLASDLWAYARLVSELFPAGLPAGWAAPLAACRTWDPVRRPRTDLLLRALQGDTVDLRDWADRPLGDPRPDGAPGTGGADGTERVPESPGRTERVPEGVGSTERVSEGAERTGATATDLGTTATRTGTTRLGRLTHSRLTPAGCVSWVFGLFVLLGGMCSGAWWWWDHTASIEADHRADEAMAALKAHKTRAELNRDKSGRTRCRELADAAWEVHATPRALGARALAHVWEEGLQDASSAWDATAWSELDTLCSVATEGRDPAAWLAYATVQGSRCRRDASPDAAVACERALAALGEFGRTVPEEEDWNWLRVEAAWVEVLVRGRVADTAARAGMPEAEARFEAVQERCAAVEPLLPWAPVNGPELVQDCLHFAGSAEDVARYLHWGRWLVHHDMGDRKLGRTTLRHVYGGAGPGCDSSVSFKEGRGGEWTVRGTDPWCLAVGHAARGCLELSREVIRVGAIDAPDHPWDTLTSAIADQPEACARTW